MRVRTLIEGDHGGSHFQIGEELSFDSDYVRKLLVNGLAEPLDDHAQEFMGKTDQHDKYVSAALQAVAAELAQEE
jgi:hypothetical protein